MFYLSLTCVFCSRDLTESDFLQEMRLDRLCFYVLIEILSIHPELLTFATLAQASSGRIYHITVPLAFPFCVFHLYTGSSRMGY